MNNESINVLQVLRSALDRGNEDGTVEFKAYVDLADETTSFWLIRAIAGMGNGKRDGFIFIGVKEEAPHKVVGLPKDAYRCFDAANIARKVAAYLTPPPETVVHRCEWDDQTLIVCIVVRPFTDIPTFVSQGFWTYSPGTILIRTSSGETKPAARETDIRSLCERIIDKHAMQAAGYYQRYARLTTSPPQSQHTSPREYALEQLSQVRAYAGGYWKAEQPYIEVFFSPCQDIPVDREAMRNLAPSYLHTRYHGFPFSSLPGWPGPQLLPQGWMATVPSSGGSESSATPDARYLWAMGVSWAFLDRDRLWEDDKDSTVVGGIGIGHVLRRLCLAVRFLRRVGKRYQWPSSWEFVIGTKLHGVRGRRFVNELDSDMERHPTVGEHAVEQSIIASLGQVEAVLHSSLRVPRVVPEIVEAVGWSLGRTDLKLDDYMNILAFIADHVDPVITLPEHEDVALFKMA